MNVLPKDLSASVYPCNDSVRFVVPQLAPGSYGMTLPLRTTSFSERISRCLGMYLSFTCQ